MYTKIILLIALTIIVSSSISIDFGQKASTPHLENGYDNNLSAPISTLPNQNLPFGIDLSDIPHQDTAGHAHQNSNDDDGKSHHFHFEHFTHRRREILFYAFARVILLLSFISSLVSGFYICHC